MQVISYLDAPDVPLHVGGLFFSTNMIQQLSIKDLRPHPDNEKIYGVEDVKELAEDIKKSNWIKPLTVTDFYGGFTIVSGHRRFAACNLLELNSLPCEVVKFQYEFEIGERLLLENRSRDKSNIQKLREYEYWKKVEGERAKERFGGKHKTESTVENFPQLEGKSRDFAAEQAGIGSGRTAESGLKALGVAETLKEQGKKDEAEIIELILNEGNFSGALDIAKGIEEGEITPDIINEVKNEPSKGIAATVRKKAKEKSIEEKRKSIRDSLEEQELKPGEKKYRIVYADPPWKYGNAMPEYVTEPQDYYLLMDTADICNMPVKDIAEPNAVLFMWSTSPHLPEALEVVKAWGFTYKTTFVWDKVKHNMGHYNSVRHEFLLVCTRGACTPDVKKLFDSVVSIERTEHSKKPEFFREIIETIYTHGNKIELFARSAPKGWDVFGNQSN
jgi:N6-adenosine-specific RNA methylase IME4/ParB-like chromosome segregation protein Spo0J